MLIALVLGGIVLGLASSVGLRLERQLSSGSKRFAADEQLAAGAEVLPIDLRALSPTAGDIPPLEARDTSLEIRATIASAAVCAAAPGRLTLAFHRGPAGRIPTPRAETGDTLWLLADSDSVERWRPIALTALRRATGLCPQLGASAGDVFAVDSLWIAEHRDSGRAQPAGIARLTRQQRFSVYRAGDGQWYLGLRTWNTAARQFNGIQPVSGPYRAPSSSHGTGFRYFDATGATLPSGASNTRAIARIEARLSVDRTASRDGQWIDSLIVVVALRNRYE